MLKAIYICIVVLVISAVFFPLFHQRPHTSYAAVCVSNLKQIANAIHCYQNDWGNGSLIYSTEEKAWGHGSGNLSWAEKLYAYHKKEYIYHCQLRDVNFAYALNSSAPERTPVNAADLIAIYECPRSGDKNRHPIRPGKNNWYDESGKAIGKASGNANLNGNKMLIRKSDNPEKNWKEVELEAKNDPQLASALVLPGPHNGGSNVCFYDGHVERVDVAKAKKLIFKPEFDFTPPQKENPPEP